MTTKRHRWMPDGTTSHKYSQKRVWRCVKCGITGTRTVLRHFTSLHPEGCREDLLPPTPKGCRTVGTRPMRSLDRLVRCWEGAAKRYNYDCNTRQAKPGDAARNQLRITAEMAFERMMDELKAVIAANDGGQRP